MGASIESGSQRCPNSCADFILDPKIKKRIGAYKSSELKQSEDANCNHKDMLEVPVNLTIRTIKNNIKISLILLKVNALNAAFSVPRRSVQKLISMKEVSPINSQPKNIRIALSAITSNDILKMNQCKSKINLSLCGSFLKYVSEYTDAHKPIVIVKKTNEKLILSSSNANSKSIKFKTEGWAVSLKNFTPPSLKKKLKLSKNSHQEEKMPQVDKM